MKKENWHIQIYHQLKKKKDQMEPGDFKFYNIAHFPLLARFTNKHAEVCPQCQENIQALNELVDCLPESLKSNTESRKTFETKKTKIENHLKKVHHMRFPGFYSSLLSFIGIIIALAVSLAINFATGRQLLNDITLIGLAVGMIGGIFIGRTLDKNIFVKNLQL